jgi:hypothetical protein
MTMIDRIIVSIPDMETTLRTKLRQINDALSALPQSYEDNPQPKLVSLCQEFTVKLNEMVEGKGPDRDFQLHMKPHFRNLKALIEATKPNLERGQITDPKDRRASPPIRC